MNSRLQNKLLSNKSSCGRLRNDEVRFDFNYIALFTSKRDLEMNIWKHII